MRLVTEGVYQTKGSICQFPFTFNGTEFTECAVDAAHQNKPYCATKAGNLDEHGQWDFCAEAGTCPGIIPCSESGTCVNGKCVCDLGFSGVDCGYVMTERDVLAKLYLATHGDSWLSRNNWLEGDHCTWFGITCGADGKVTGINLGNNMLDGTLPGDLGFFSKLQILQLENNMLAGTIPRSLEQLPSLTVFNIARNEFIGSFPNIKATNAVSCDGNCIVSKHCALGLACGVSL